MVASSRCVNQVILQNDITSYSWIFFYLTKSLNHTWWLNILIAEHINILSLQDANMRQSEDSQLEMKVLLIVSTSSYKK